MNSLHATPFNHIRALISARYATITPNGIVTPPASQPYNPFSVEMIAFRPARTRYLYKKPVCRSLNGNNSCNSNSICALCEYYKSCTPQIAVDFLYRIVPYRLLLAFTSANNFMMLTRKLIVAKIPFEAAKVKIITINHGKWGETTFELT